jgi:hypothetical protein
MARARKASSASGACVDADFRQDSVRLSIEADTDQVNRREIG